MKLELTPITLRESNAYVTAKHRHHGPVRGQLFSIGAAQNGEMVGVVIVGRPLARMLQDGYTAEVLRLCADGTKNVCSLLYAAAWRAVRAMGYTRLITYILDTEHGTSLKAAGWKCVGLAGGGSWSRKSRPRVDTHPLQGKIRYEVAA